VAITSLEIWPEKSEDCSSISDPNARTGRPRPARQGGLELQIAWGKRMLLDTSSQVHAEALPKLSELQAELIEHYKPIGPILA
jgi:hypothetical protein